MAEDKSFITESLVREGLVNVLHHACSIDLQAL